MKKIKSPLKAIRAHCIQCVGTWKEVENCGGEDTCPLFDFRFGKNPYRIKKVLTEEEKFAIAERFRLAKEKTTNE